MFLLSVPALILRSVSSLADILLHYKIQLKTRKLYCRILGTYIYFWLIPFAFTFKSFVLFIPFFLWGQHVSLDFGVVSSLLMIANSGRYFVTCLLYFTIFLHCD